MKTTLAAACTLCVASCATAPARAPDVRLPDAFDAVQAYELPPPPQSSPPPRRPLEWPRGAALLQGFIGVSYFQDVTIHEGSVVVDGDEGDVDQLPLIGGGGQWKLAGQRVDFGIEGMFGLSGRANAVAFAAGGGGAAVAVDVDLLLIDVFGGPFASMYLGDAARIYAGAGPLVQFADYDQSGGALSDSGSGFGSGWYARTGIEFILPSRTMVGFGVRWSDSTIDLSGGLGDIDIEGIQAVITVTH